MGVPKFYRWISERYPCLSEVVKEYQIPEFDNLYLDMNGIIHVCSHPNDNDPHFRISEEKMFKDIFHYIEVLFRLIQPKKVFFMAVDGVAPRAKMNQQRGRRFRSAKEAVDAEKRARDRGEVLPTEERFDSNCITPGTEFMARLDTHLQYFVTYKISQDKMWQDCKVIYSGHETPGEGEHKIMEYIRYTKSQPNYNPNTRHCLYGLDADLIMLGLTSHEPHFSLLREEVRFGGKKDSNSRTPTPEETTFHLLHLSLMREYISYEFNELKSTLPFPFDLENIIDDWVLMGFLVGNDFIPHLPNLHINKEALPILYQTYKSVLPTLGGYLNSGGKLNLERFEKFIEKLAQVEIDQFQELSADLKYFSGKRSKNGSAFKVNKGKACDMELVPFDLSDEEGTDDEGEINIEKTFEKLGLQPQTGLFDDGEDDEDGWEEDEEFRQHKREYYMTKMNYENVDSDVLKEQATCYVRGIQWILNYYYNGICSWSWFYPYHYAPYVSDIRGFSDLKLEYNMGKPFMPYEQLLAVLPPLSKKLLPDAYQGLMIKEDSPLKEYYPETFQTDLNGKQQEWEAVVLIPFIDEKKLLDAMSPCNEKLTESQKQRNIHGPMYIYSYTPDNLREYRAPKNFPSVGVNHAVVELVYRDKWEILPDKILKGLCSKVKQDLYFVGFPTLKHIPHKFHIGKEAVKVFQQNSRGENFILDITEQDTKPDLKDLANQLLGKTLFVSWPHLVEAKVTAVASMSDKYYRVNGELRAEVLEGYRIEETIVSRNSIATHYHDRWGINVGNTEILVYAKAMTGRRYVPTPNGRITLEKSWSNIIQPYAYQTVVRDIAVHDPGYREHISVLEFFAPRTKVFMLGQPCYGSLGEVIEINPSHKGRIRVVMTVLKEPNFDAMRKKQDELDMKYMPGYIAGQKVGISTHLLARLTGTVFLLPPSADNPGELDMKNRLNIGLNLKNNKKSEEVVGYTRKVLDANGAKTIWLYSPKTVETIIEYQSKFPEIFDHLAEQKGEKDIFFQDEVFGQEQYKERVAELTAWLKESDFAKAMRQKCGTPCLDEAVVTRIVEEVDKVSTVLATSMKMQVRPHLLFKPNPLQGSTPPDPSVTYKLFDRVTNCREGFSVPLGATGTVIGIHPADKEADVLYDILFDEAFEEGLTFAGPATAKHCYRLHSASLINLSHGSRHNSTGSANGNMRPEEPRPSAWNNNRQDQNYHYNHHSQSQAERQGFSPHASQQHNSYQSPQGNFNRGQGYSCTPPKNNQGFDIASPQPPDPNQLPNPSGLYGMAEVRSAREVECVVFGTYYALWNKIHQQGIGRIPGHIYIVCFSYVPKIKPGPKAFQLLIFIDIKKALDDGIKFYRVNEQQISCTGDRQGFIRPKYFSKVVDCESNSIIYTPQYGFGTEAIPANFGRVPAGAYGQTPHAGRGRGRGFIGQQPQGIQLYENIWSQIQREDNEHGDARPAQGRGPSNAAHFPGGREAGKSDNGRTEVSVEDIFRGARACATQAQDQSLAQQLSADLLSMLKPTQQQPHRQGAENAAHKDDSPVKSAFVPTQVIRNRTPRKPKPNASEEPGRPVPAAEGQSSISADVERPQAQQTQRHIQHPNGNGNKPRRKVRSRLAVNFGQPFMEDT